MSNYRNFIFARVQFTIIAIICVCTFSTCGGPHSNPERVVRAWIEAIVAGDCEKAASYYAPYVRNEVKLACGPDAIYPILRARIDEMWVEQSPWDPNVMWVNVYGEIERRDLGTSDYWQFAVIQINGKWYFLHD
ncbi:MAG: hypothetical protein QXS54_12275 [Candidatus Methanomethylicaceae archaeon]